ncbi:cytochrome P450 [Mycena galopus ATCC 62051]|nr:cytochrome P450 [Mycena galopus ATCC 62051]
MDDLRFLLLYGVLAGVLFASCRKLLHDRRLENIPVVGSSGFLSSYRDGWKFLRNAPDLIQRGYDQYPEGIFRVARLFRWEYVVCGPNLIKELAGASERVVSFDEGVEEFTMGRNLRENRFHLNAVRTTGDEIVCAFNDVLKLEGSEWKSLTVLPVIMAIVARVSNRLFVGLPLCRDEAYLANNVYYTLDVMRSADRITLCPPFLRPLLGPLISNKDKSNAKALEILGPLIEKRLRKERELGPDWPGKPNDFISWMLDFAEGEQRIALPLTLRILSINMAAIHTSSMAFTHALFDLTAHPEHLLPMREEVERVVSQEGWTKAALNNMVKVDSFLRESQRVNNNSPVGMSRKIVAKDGFWFSDGTVLPNGAYVCVAARPIHYDDLNYEHAATFDGFRFARERAEHTMISTAVDHLPFGTGKHACPVSIPLSSPNAGIEQLSQGRFFAATELKAMMAHLVMNYDVKAEVEGVRPPDNIFGIRMTPDATGKVQFRKRQ